MNNYSNYKILIVDDLTQNIQLLGNVLLQENFQISYAKSGKKALETLEYQKIDLILLDIMMPEMDGFEVCRRIKSNPQTSEIPIIFLSAKSDKENIVKGFEVGGVDYITKPFNEKELLIRIKTQLDLKKAKDDILITKLFLDQILENLPVAVAVSEIDSNTNLYFNRKGEELFNVKREDIIGFQTLNFIPNYLRSQFYIWEKMLLESEQKTVSGRLELKSENDSKFLRVINTLISDNFSNPTYNLSIFEDVTDLTKAYERLMKMANYDALTELANRHKMIEVLEHEIIRSNRNHRYFSVLLLDIDDFKIVNDTYGHDAGDFVLKEISKIMKDSVRKQDTVSRWGGEEFLLCLPETDLNGAVIVANKIKDKIANKLFCYQGVDIKITVTIGVSQFEPVKDMDTVIKEADLALYSGKGQGKNQVFRYQI